MNAAKHETEEQATRRDAAARKFAERLQGLAARALHRGEQLDDDDLWEMGEAIMNVRTSLVLSRPSAFVPTTGNWPWRRIH